MAKGKTDEDKDGKLQERMVAAYNKAMSQKWERKNFLSLCDEYDIATTSFGDGNVLRFNDLNEQRVKKVEDGVAEFPNGVPGIFDEPHWTDEQLAELKLTKEKAVPTMIYQAILAYGEEHGIKERQVRIMHGPIANGRQKMLMEVLAELFAKVKKTIADNEVLGPEIPFETKIANAMGSVAFAESKEKPDEKAVEATLAQLKELEKVVLNGSTIKEAEDEIAQKAGHANAQELLECGTCAPGLEDDEEEGDEGFDDLFTDKAHDGLLKTDAKVWTEVGDIAPPPVPLDLTDLPAPFQGQKREKIEVSLTFTPSPENAAIEAIRSDFVPMSVTLKAGEPAAFIGLDMGSGPDRAVVAKRILTADLCDVEECNNVATHYVGAEKLRSCEGCLKHEKFKKLKKRILIADAQAEAEKAKAEKERAEAEKLAAAEALVKRHEGILVTHRWTGECRPLGEIADRLLYYKWKLAAVKSTLAAETKKIENNIADLHANYDDSVLKVLEEKLPRTADGDYDVKYLPLSFARVSARKEGGRTIQTVDKNELDDWAYSLSEDELAAWGVKKKRVVDLDVILNLYTASGGMDSLLPPGVMVLDEPVKEVGSWDVAPPS